MFPDDGTGLEHEVYLWNLLTPTRDCVTAPVGQVAASLVSHLQEAGFDQAPVTEPKFGHNQIIGLVETGHLLELLQDGSLLQRGDPAVRFPCITVETTLDQLLASFATERALLVMHIEQDEDGVTGDVVGLLTISDLNRHPFRAVLYSLLASLEAALARVVEQQFADLSRPGSGGEAGAWNQAASLASWRR